ncbi:FtsZ/tubulin family protein [Mycoplasmopsis primatum]|uniref:hypothetical protein n=1 Tax=Mycoplasmopsis primatum TaxID=55604 RepID=UPI00049580A0|nr:hypothetical protein [Mycoplasmopsis primatum]
MNTLSKAKNIKVKVLGIGGAGNNMINSIIQNNEFNTENIEFWALNTDLQHLNKDDNFCNNKLLLINSHNNGGGAGGNPLIGKECALNTKDEILKILQDTELLVLAAGLGGGTGTGATPVIAEWAKKLGIITIAILTTPFEFEGSGKFNIALDGLGEIKKQTNSFSIVQNQSMLDNYPDLPYDDALKLANNKLKHLIYSISKILYSSWSINIDFNDLINTIKNGSNLFVAHSRYSGTNRVKNAINNIIKDNPFKITPNNTYKSVLIFFELDSRGSLKEVNDAISMLRNYFGENVYIKFGIINNCWNHKNDDFFAISVIAGQDSFIDESQITLQNINNSLKNTIKNDDSQTYETNSDHQEIGLEMINDKSHKNKESSDEDYSDNIPSFFS